MPLSPAQKRLNDNELHEIFMLIASLANDAQAKLKKLNENFLFILGETLNANDILLSIPQGLDDLRRLLEESIDQGNDAEFKKRLSAWVIAYQKLEEKASHDLRKLAHEQPRGIARSLIELGAVEDNAWGDDFDMRAVLKSVMTDPEAVKGKGTFVLPPVRIVAGINATKEEKERPHSFLMNSIKTVVENNPDRKIKLLIPVVSDTHWRVAKVKLNKSKIDQAILWDPASNPTLTQTPAFKNTEKAIKALDKKAVTVAISAGIQKDDNHCFEYTAKKILQELPPEQALSKGLTVIRDEKNPEVMRNHGTISELTANLPSLPVKNQNLDTELKKIFTQPAQKTLEQDVFSALNNSKKLKGQAKKDLVDFQIKFDAILTKKLEKLYQENAHVADEVLLNQARVYAFEQMQKTLGFFAVRPEEVRSTAAKEKSAFVPGAKVSKKL